MKKNSKLIIATRGSKLALWQAEWVKSQLINNNPGLEVDLKKIKTTGDKILDVPLAQVGGKGLFVKEIEEDMLRGEADLAVHSMKDVPADLPEGLHLTAICEREDPRDALIAGSPDVRTLHDLPAGARVGTTSLRRICQLLNIRPDLKIVQLRGNVDTRLRKLSEGEFDAIILATAGIKRLGHADRITQIIPADISLPAIGQGAVGIECRINDDFTNNLLKALDHGETSVCVRTERAFLKKLEGGCQVPIAAYAQLIDQGSGVRGQETGHRQEKSEIRNPKSEILIIDGLVGSLNGETLIKDRMEGEPEDAESIGTRLAEELLSRGADRILAEVYGNS